MSGKILTMYLINAIGIHKGGGLRILISILSKIEKDALVLIDDRLDVESLPRNAKIKFLAVSSHPLSRLYFELKHLHKKYDKIISLNSMPFLLLKTEIVYFQNLTLVMGSFFSFKNFLFRCICKKSARFVVQTRHVKQILSDVVDRRKITIDAPYEGNKVKLYEEKCYDFFYPCSDDPHKNVDIVLDAWRLLAKQGLYPRLALTLNGEKSAKIMQLMREDRKIAIVNLGWLSESAVEVALGKTNYLLFASNFETLGLPLCDANASNVRVMAADEDYVFEVCTPVRTFNQRSSISLANAVAMELEHTGLVRAMEHPKVLHEFINGG